MEAAFPPRSPAPPHHRRAVRHSTETIEIDQARDRLVRRGALTIRKQLICGVEIWRLNAQLSPVSFPQHLHVMRHMSRDNVGQRAHGEWIVAGNPAAFPSVGWQIAK